MKHKMVDYKRMQADTEEILKSLGVHIPAGSLVKDLSVGYQQIVEIAKAVSCKAK